MYADSAVRLCQAELALFSEALLRGRVSSISAEEIAGITYITFDCDDLNDADAAVLGNLSALYALFERVDGDLRPVQVRSLDCYDDDLVSILKYPGKTNEQFTRLLLNVTLLSSRFATQLPERRFRVLDPLCGRGTTLNVALLCGFDACGIDTDARDVEAYATFIQRWLKDKRLKHEASFGPVRRDRSVIAKRLDVTLAPTKEAFKAGDVQRLEVLAADTIRAADFIKPESIDLVVTDAPYGVQHGSRGAAGVLARSPLDLLASAAPVWATLLRSGGALGLSWNTRVAPRADAVSVLRDAGLNVNEGGVYDNLEHRVDQSIVRDVLVAVKD